MTNIFKGIAINAKKFKNTKPRRRFVITDLTETESKLKYKLVEKHKKRKFIITDKTEKEVLAEIEKYKDKNTIACNSLKNPIIINHYNAKSLEDGKYFFGGKKHHRFTRNFKVKTINIPNI